MPRFLLLLAWLASSGASSLLASSALADDLEALAARAPELAHVVSLGPRAEGEAPLTALVLSAGAAPLEQRQGLLVVAGLEGSRAGDSALVLALLERLLAREDLAERLGERALVFVPSVRGGAAERLAAGWPFSAAGTPELLASTPRPDDRDRDGRQDEDGPDDLDGDGRAAWMRVPDGKGTWVVDEHDPRALRKARTERGERGSHRLLREGRDDDGDGEFGEDERGGVLLDSNFPHDWREHEPPSGPFPLSEPEARALADFVLRHPGLVGVLVLGAHDTLFETPAAAKKVERGGFRGFRQPLDGLLEEDVATLKEWRRRWKGTGAHEHEVKGEPLSGGSFLAWAYHQAGRWPLALRPWAPPEKLPKEEEDAKEQKEEKKEKEGKEEEAKEDAEPSDEAALAAEAKSEPEASEERERGKEERGKKKKEEGEPESEEVDDQKPTSDPSSPVPAAVLAWLDAKHGGAGFLPWTPFEHPQLGTVEIGGLLPGLSAWGGWEPQGAEKLADELAAFVLDALAWLPSVAFEDLEVSDQGGGLYAIEAALVNPAPLPTAPQFGADAQLVRPVRVRLELPPGVLRVAGPEQVLVPRLPGGGGRQELRWVVMGGAAGARLLLAADADALADVSLEIVLP